MKTEKAVNYFPALVAERIKTEEAPYRQKLMYEPGTVTPSPEVRITEGPKFTPCTFIHSLN